MKSRNTDKIKIKIKKIYMYIGKYKIPDFSKNILSMTISSFSCYLRPSYSIRVTRICGRKHSITESSV